MLELAVARADGAAGEAEDLRGYEARSAAAGERGPRPQSSRSRRPASAMIVRRARWVLPIDARRRSPAAGSRSPPAASSALGAGAPPGAAEDLGDVARPAGAGQRAHASRTELDGRARAAGGVDGRVDSRAAARCGARVRRAATPRSRDGRTSAAVAMRATGTVLVGDISNTLTSPARAGRRAASAASCFTNCSASIAADPARLVREAWDASAPKRDRDLESAGTPRTPEPGLRVDSASSRTRRTPCRRRCSREIAGARGAAPLSVHLGESPEEIEFLRDGPRTDSRDCSRQLGVWTDALACARRAIRCEYLPRLGYLQPGMLVVHGVHLDRRRPGATARARGAVLVTCPRSNRLGGRRARRGSRTSTRRACRWRSAPTAWRRRRSLNLFDELAELRRIAPDVSAARAARERDARSAPRPSGSAHDYGTLTAGKRAALVAVRGSGRTRDVEEYLVSGVPPSAIRRVA